MTDEIERVDSSLEITREESEARLSRLVAALLTSTQEALAEQTQALLCEIELALVKCGLRLGVVSGDILTTRYPEVPPILALLNEPRGLVLRTQPEGKEVLTILVASRGIVVPGNLSEPNRSYDYDISHILDAIGDVFELRLEQKRLREAQRVVEASPLFGGQAGDHG